MIPRALRVSWPAPALMIALMMALGLMLTLSHVALRLSDSIDMHAEEERLRGAAIAQSLAAGAFGAASTGGDAVLGRIAADARKALDNVSIDITDADGAVLHSTDPARTGQKLKLSRLVFGSGASSAGGMSYTGPMRYEGVAVLHGPQGPNGFLVLGFDSDAVARAIADEISTDLIVGVVWLGVLVLLSVPVVRNLTRPLEALKRRVEGLREGSYGGMTPLPTAIREVDVLQHGFIALASALADKEQENRSLLDRLRHQVEVVSRDLERQSSFLRSVMYSLHNALITTDEAGLVTSATPRAPEAVGRPVVSGHALADQLPEPARVRAALERVLAGGGLERLDLADGGARFLELDLMPLEGPAGERMGALARVADVTRQRKLEVQVARAERLSNVGEIAAGFAHELGNALHVVLGLGKVLLSELPPDAPGRSDIVAIVKESEQANALIGRFKMFASPSRGKMGLLELEAIVLDAAQILDKEMRRHQVTFSSVAAPDTPAVHGDPALLRQVVLNLLLNAVQAMPAGGTLSAKLARNEKGGVSLEISDTGTGIGTEDLPRIFDPFFTTKREGEGTGLGLSVVQSILTVHGASIDVDSEPGRGTTFTIDFPEPHVVEEAA